MNESAVITLLSTPLPIGVESESDQALRATYPDIAAAHRADVRDLIDAARARADADCVHLTATTTTGGGSEVDNAQVTADPGLIRPDSLPSRMEGS